MKPFIVEMAKPEDIQIFLPKERVKKSQVSVERLAQMFGVSYDTKKAFQPKHVFLVNECYNYGKKQFVVDAGATTGKDWLPFSLMHQESTLWRSLARVLNGRTVMVGVTFQIFGKTQP